MAAPGRPYLSTAGAPVAAARVAAHWRSSPLVVVMGAGDKLFYTAHKKVFSTPKSWLAFGREYWMIYRGPGFIGVVWFAPAHPLPPLAFVTGDTQEDRERETTCLWESGEGGGRGAESYNRNQAWSSINNSLLSGDWPIYSYIQGARRNRSSRCF